MKFLNDLQVMLRDTAVLESTYDCKMNVYEWKNTEVNGFTEEEKVLKYSDVPCGVSQIGTDLTSDSDLPNAKMKIKVFCSEKYRIKAGYLLEIELSDELKCFKRVSLAKHYKTHQELFAIGEIY